MTHNLTMTAEQMAAIEAGKHHIITKHKTTYATGDRLIMQLEGHREEIEARIIEIETERLHSGWCCLSLKVVQVDDLKHVSLSGVNNYPHNMEVLRSQEESLGL